MAAVTICSDFGAPQIKSDTVFIVSPFISHEEMGIPTLPASWDEAQAGINIAGRNINNLSYADDTTLMAES